MNVHITSTPEFSSTKTDEVISLLQSIPGVLKFNKGKPLTQALCIRLNPIFEDISNIKSLTFDEYFDLIQGYRELREIDDQDFIIIITSIRHDRHWFSGFNKKNIFIHGDEWDMISNADSKFGIAYQCVENIFQSLIDLDIMNYKNEPNIHMEAIGCINDFCGYKPDIIRKLQTANICHSCFDKAEKMFSKYILSHILNIIEEIRKEFVASKKFQSVTMLEKVKVDHQGAIFIGDKKLKLATIPTVMYIGFLKHIDGIPNNQLCRNKNLFEEIYKLVKPKNRGEYSIEKMLCKQITYKRSEGNHIPTFETNRTRIKEGLIECLGATIANYYTINLVEDENHNMLFKVNLSQDQIDTKSIFS